MNSKAIGMNMRQNKKLSIGVFCLISARLMLQAQETPALNPAMEGSKPDKSAYHLFNRTPDALLREMSTDRPDKTESPYTLDAGHFQVEMDLATYTHDHDTANGADVKTDGYAVAPVNLKAGLLNNVDLQVVIETYNWVRTKDRVANTVIRQSGFGDVIPRLKFNLWGNDGGSTAFGVMPFMKIPSNQDNLGNRAVEGGVILPFALELPAGFSLGMMSEFDFNEDQSGGAYHPEFINSITLGHGIVGKLEAYMEFFSQVSTERDSEWIGTFDVGMTYGLTDNMRLDAGVNIGVTRSADDLNPFVGFSFRF